MSTPSDETDSAESSTSTHPQRDLHGWDFRHPQGQESHWEKPARTGAARASSAPAYARPGPGPEGDLARSGLGSSSPVTHLIRSWRSVARTDRGRGLECAKAS